MQKTFVASSELKPMAVQLIDGHSKSAYAGVERFAKAHRDSAGALAWLVLGYARWTDPHRDEKKTIAALRNAKPAAGEFGDVVDHLLAQAYRSQGQDDEVVIVLDGFAKRYPTSVYLREDVVARANALTARGGAEQALLELHDVRKPFFTSVELAVAKAQVALEHPEKAADSLQKIYYEAPLSAEADEAGILLRKLGITGTPQMQRTRADLMASGRQSQQAANEYKQLIAQGGGTPAPMVQASLARMLVRMDRDSEAATVLTALESNPGLPQDADANALRLFLRGELARSRNDDTAQSAVLDEMRRTTTQSPWLEEALLSTGNKYLLRRDLAAAAAYYDELAHRFPAGKYGASAHWKSAWLLYRLDRQAEAKGQFEDQIRLFGRSNEVPNALYWRGRIAENEHDLPTARACYAKLSDSFRNYYYSVLARERLKEIGVSGAAEPEFLASVVTPTATQAPRESPDGVADPRLAKAKLLTNGGLFDFALKELQAASQEPGNDWALTEMVRVQLDAGRPFAALQLLKRSLPGYYAAEITTLPKTIRDALFPRPFWGEIRNNAEANRLDPYLVAALIRQESEFNPAAVSHANAFGLMQLLPSVGKTEAKKIKLKGYSSGKLLDPSTNIKLGTHYFRNMIDETGGKVEYALAAYNAGTNRVYEWLNAGQFRDVPEFVESIPFTETREYVQAIVRNHNIYRRMYAGQ